MGDADFSCHGRDMCLLSFGLGLDLCVCGSFGGNFSTQNDQSLPLRLWAGSDCFRRTCSHLRGASLSAGNVGFLHGTCIRSAGAQDFL
jgi:hypothetical protein